MGKHRSNKAQKKRIDREQESAHIRQWANTETGERQKTALKPELSRCQVKE